MTRFACILAAVALAMPAGAAFAQPGITYAEAHGAASGRSPHKAYREIVREERGCRAAPIHVPGGRLSHYGLNAMPQGTCVASATTLAAADTPGTARD